MARKTSARSIKRYTKHSSRPQLELDLSGDRAMAMLEEAAAKDAEAMARLKEFIADDEAAIEALRESSSNNVPLDMFQDAGRPPAIQEPASRRPMEFR